jgi:hypothetical protein
VSFDGHVGFGATLQDALSQVVPGLTTSSAPPSTSTSTSTGTGSSSTSGTVSAAVRSYLAQAETYYAAAQAALKSGNFATYGTDTALMKTALDNAQKAAQAKPAPSKSPTPSPSKSP